MRKVIKKPQIMYLAKSIEHHLNNLPDDHAKWLEAFKMVWKVLVTMDNMGLWEHDYEPDIITMDSMFEQLRNDFARHDIYMPQAARYYK